MTTEQIVLIITEVALILVEIQIITLKKDLRREIIVRKSRMRTMQDCIRRLWVDIRAAGIERFNPEDISENDSK